MLRRIENAIFFYKGKLELKERRLDEYQEMIENNEGLTILQSERREVLLAERSLIKRFIDDLEYIKETE